MKKILRYFTILIGTSVAFCQAMDFNLQQANRAFGLPEILLQVQIPNSNKVLVAYQKNKLAVVFLQNDKVEVKKINYQRSYDSWIARYRLSLRDCLFQSTILDIQVSSNGNTAAILFEKESFKYIGLIDDL
ncbi:hypothetical protein JST56_02915 [Candidatus Dependentiae bacterium]|nr:hypothetical protein [Candidatus Dependentiae bacterium]